MRLPLKAHRGLLACLAFLGCSSTLHPIPSSPIADPEVLFQRLSRRSSVLKALSATARLESYSSKGVVKGRITILADLQGRLRIDGWTPTDQWLGTLLALPDSFIYFERGAKECLVGPPCPRNIGMLLPINLELKEAIALLFGIPPIHQPKDGWTVAFDRKVGAYLLSSVVEGGGRQDLWLNEDGTPVAAELHDLGGLVYRFEARDFVSVADGILFPRRIRAKTRADHNDVTILFRSLDFRPEISEGDFTLECPKGTLVKWVTCED